MKEFLIPSSKSISNRLLVIQQLSQSKAKINNLSLAQDTILMQELLSQIDNSSNETLYCHNAGTVVRFLLSLLSMKEGTWIIDSDKRMKERPIEDLVDALKEIGAQIDYLEEKGKLPLRIKGQALQNNNPIKINSKLSSQFASSLLLISPYIKGGLELEIDSPVSFPYIQMTISLMREFGAKVQEKQNRIRVEQGEYIFKETLVEGDWSSACFAFEKLCISNRCKMIIKNLSPNSSQADRIAMDYFSYLGIESQFKDNNLNISYNPQSISKQETLIFNIKDCPDIFPSLAIAGFVSNKTIIFEAVDNLIHKESNRLKAVLEGLQSIGAKAEIDQKNRFVIKANNQTLENPKEKIIIKTYNDHRISMAFGMLREKYDNIIVDDYDCVSKSFPFFWLNVEN
ncbi:3-phosphoshikimate 1-carboxyvinyltransferase [bioreactor metagenome]|uniref:3-phosphoshikimate 1-carboxyvinyltransferase n=1 Tax=bioreactor metagenome TaxID=1076179 RepID=A0A644VJW5_9ZZZZ